MVLQTNFRFNTCSKLFIAPHSVPPCLVWGTTAQDDIENKILIRNDIVIDIKWMGAG